MAEAPAGRLVGGEVGGGGERKVLASRRQARSIQSVAGATPPKALSLSISSFAL